MLMGPGYFVIAILGCADGGSSCTPVATLQTRYDSAAQCSAATPAALEANSNFDFPTLLARCRPATGASSANAQRHLALPASARRS
jgi:acyl-CoA synthetase (AMP-forming)/AMP-acid ligase II